MPTMRHQPTTLAVIAFFLGGVFLLQAEVTMPAIFGEHMVLQQGMKVPVWGTADPGEDVTVTVGKATAKTKAEADGKWRVELPVLAGPGATPVTMTVQGKNLLTFSDVLIGDVWLCSGQSNMEFPLQAYNKAYSGDAQAATMVPQANDSQLRFFIVEQMTSLDPQPDVKKSPTAMKDHWQVCTPKSAAAFSAVSYYFGRDLRTHLQRPIGLIGSYWGGTPAQAWTSISGLQKDPVLQHYVDDHQKTEANLAQATAAYPALKAAYTAEQATWNQTVGDAYNKALDAWNDAARQAVAAGQAPPPKPAPASPMPKAPVPPDGGHLAPGNLFNGMIAPLIPFALKGAIWYQGEGNAFQPEEYRVLFPAMISDWREKWGEGNFPFLFVQLAGFQPGKFDNWAFLREAQAMTLSLPNTGMAVAVDIGDPFNIHPKDKLDVGKRLALAARHVAYGEKLVYSGPVYQSIQARGKAIDVTFTHEGGGLVIGSAPWVAGDRAPIPTTSLAGFTIAGSDYKWVPAEAKIQGNAVEVSSAQVPQPIAVRYDWLNSPEGNLYNKDGLPAAPFRTDKQPYVPPWKGAKAPAAPAP
jgi:sialate O-acetylesterase